MAFALIINGVCQEIEGDFTVGDVNYPAGWLDAASAEEMAAVGAIEIVDDIASGADRRIVGRELVDRGGVPTRIYLTEPVPADEIATALLRTIEALSAAAFARGFAPAHPSFTGERLQVRDSDDRTNWLTSQASYAAAVQAGYGDVIDASFRTAGNRTVTVSYADGLAVLLGMAAWGRTIMARAWTLKDAVTNGDPVDIDEGWPA